MGFNTSQALLHTAYKYNILNLKAFFIQVKVDVGAFLRL